MLGKIKYSYIPQTKSTDAILSSLAYAIKATGGIDYVIIDNKAKGRRLYPSRIAENVMNCDKNKLEETIKGLIDKDIEVILLNDFDINLDEVREKFCTLVKTYDILLCVNNILDLDNSKSNISIYIDPDVDELDYDEWLDIKEEILQNLEDAQDEIKESKSSDAPGLSSLLDLFGLDKLYDDNKPNASKEYSDADDIEDLNIKEQYSYVIDDLELTVSLTDKDDVLINNEEDFIIVPKKQMRFLLDALSKLIKE